jgi:hypothetical protein
MESVMIAAAICLGHLERRRFSEDVGMAALIATSQKPD